MKKITDDYISYAHHRLKGGNSVISSYFLVRSFLTGQKVLDIGCSDGLYLKDFGPESLGIEQIPELSKSAEGKGLHVLNGNIPEILPSIPAHSFPVVFFSHVMEHLDSPIESLREINRILSDDGLLVLGLPTENNLFRTVLRKDYFDGTHIYAFSVRNALKLLHDTGFTPVSVYYDLPKCRGKVGRFLIRLYQLFPFKEAISMAYWIVAKKVAK